MINKIRSWYIKKLLSNCLYALADLQRAFFVNYLKKDYIKKRKYYQKILNKKSKKFFFNMIKTSNALKNDSPFKAAWATVLPSLEHENARDFYGNHHGQSPLPIPEHENENNFHGKPAWAIILPTPGHENARDFHGKNKINDLNEMQDIFFKIDHLSEIIFSLNQLRFRVVDYTTFKVCAQEMQEIEKFSIMMIIQLANFKNSSVELPIFEEKIHQFENIYNRALQIVAIDPLVFMFFIQDLYALNEELKQLSLAIFCLQDKKNVNRIN